MKWLEIIELQTVACNRKLLEIEMKKLIIELDKETKIGNIDLVLESRVLDTSGNLIAVLENCYHPSKKHRT